MGSLECQAKELNYPPVILSAYLHGTCYILGILGLIHSTYFISFNSLNYPIGRYIFISVLEMREQGTEMFGDLSPNFQLPSGRGRLWTYAVWLAAVIL